MGTIAQLFESGKKSSDKGHFSNLVMLARVDGVVDETETKLLNRMAKRLSLTDEQVKEIVENENSYPTIPPFSREDRYERFIQFIQMVCVDGIVDPAEEKLVSKYGTALGMIENDLNKVYPIILEKVKEGVSRGDILDELI